MHPPHCKSVRVVTHASSITALIARLRLAGRPSGVAETLQHGWPPGRAGDFMDFMVSMTDERVTDDGQTDRLMHLLK